MTYTDKNLVKYEDAIRLHFDARGKTAWLTMRNYGYVFGKRPWDAVMMVTVGVPATEEGALPYEKSDSDPLVLLGFQQGEFKPDPKTISIASMLDAIDVIRIQVAILNKTSKPRSTKVLERRVLHELLVEALTDICAVPFSMAYAPDDNNFFQNTSKNLDEALNKPPGASIAKAIKEYCVPDIGFTAFFPQPSLIVQEERTPIAEPDREPPDGKTCGLDTRLIDPIPSGMPEPKDATLSTEFPSPLFGEHRRRQPEWEFQWIVDELDQTIRERNVQEPVSDTRLHVGIERISCFGFRGDDRDPLEHRAAGGFLPGVTRTDAGVAKFQDDQFLIDRNLFARPWPQEDPDKPRTWKPAKLGEPNKPQTIDSEYLKAIKKLDVMNLGAYTGVPDFKGYISATKSTAIAKYFANLYSKTTEFKAYCYAVRCRGGFQLQSHVPDALPESKDSEKAKSYLKKLHSFNSYAEQEVAVAGAIWWEHIVGMRVLQCNEKGQFFSGPVFLKNDLMWDDNYGFSALFELLSGKSQGDSPGVIEKSYEHPPFQCVLPGLASAGCNSISQVSALAVPPVRVTPQALAFSRQIVSTASATQIVKLTNLGKESLFVNFTQIISDKFEDFKVLRSPDFTDRAVEVKGGEHYTVHVQFEPNETDETGRARKAEERTATLVILTKTSRGDRSPATRHIVSLMGTAVPKPAPFNISPLTLDFGGIARGTFSSSRIVALVNRGETTLDVTIQDLPCFSTDIKSAQLQPGENCAINVTFKAPEKEGEVRGRLEIYCAGEGVPSFVSLSGVSAKPKYGLVLEPASLNFGSVKVGASSDFLYGTLKNNGNAPVTIETARVVPEGEFHWEQIGEEGNLLRAGESRKMRVFFAPRSVGTFHSDLIIKYKDKVYSSHHVSLEGDGYAGILRTTAKDFSRHAVGTQSEKQVFNFTNPGDFEISVTIEVTGEHKDDFPWTYQGELVVKARGQLNVAVFFKPRKVGESKAILSITYRVGGSKQKVTEEVLLSGTGAAEA